MLVPKDRIEELQELIQYDLREVLEEAADLAAEIATIAQELGGEIGKVVGKALTNQTYMLDDLIQSRQPESVESLLEFLRETLKEYGES